MAWRPGNDTPNSTEVPSVKRAAIALPSIDYYVSSIAVTNSNGALLDLILGVQLKPQHQAHLWTPQEPLSRCFGHTQSLWGSPKRHTPLEGGRGPGP
jgi:hypothetical protein